jgi:hypothetical protein
MMDENMRCAMLYIEKQEEEKKKKEKKKKCKVRKPKAASFPTLARH